MPSAGQNATRANEQAAIAEAVRTGVALHQRGLLDDAERLYAGILKLAPDHFDALHLLGVVRQQRGETAEAVRLIGMALKVKANSAEALTNYGQVLLQIRRLSEALASFDQALAIEPDLAQARINRATVLVELGRAPEALADAEHILTLDPAHLLALIKRGNALSAMREHVRAIESYDAALAIDPSETTALNNRGYSLGELARSEEALADYDAALAIRSDYLEALINRGNALVETHRETEAIESYEKALALAPGQPDALFNLGINRLRTGDFARGWDGYEWRWNAKEFSHTRRIYPHPRWKGERVAGTLLISGEQGLGDQILFAGMLPDVAAHADMVVVEVEPRLVPLFARSFPGINTVPREQSLYSGPAQAQIPLGSLGQYLRKDEAAFPRERAYLVPDRACAASLRARLNDGRTVIGLSWRSRNPKYENSKSTALADFAPLLRLSGCRFVDLQYGDTSAEREAVERELGVRIERLEDIDNTADIDGLAALIAACDAVVTVSNTTAHLSGGLGKETFVLVPFGHGRMWCWMTGRDDTPFYPRVRLVRQNRAQPWAGVVATAAAAVGACAR